LTGVGKRWLGGWRDNSLVAETPLFTGCLHGFGWLSVLMPGLAIYLIDDMAQEPSGGGC